MKSNYMKNSNTFRQTIFLRILRPSVFCLIALGTGAATRASFIETYDDGTDVGLWHCSLGVPRIIEPNGGNPGAYLSRAASAPTCRHGRASRRGINQDLTTPTRSTVSTRAIGPASVLPA
jgi:hypothetical protein